MEQIRLGSGSAHEVHPSAAPALAGSARVVGGATGGTVATGPATAGTAATAATTTAAAVETGSATADLDPATAVRT